LITRRVIFKRPHSAPNASCGSGNTCPRVPAPELLIRGVAFNVSPKLAHAGVPECARIVPEALEGFADSGQATFKFVMQAPDDLAEIAVLEERCGLAPVWVMPEGVTSDQVIGRAGQLSDQVIERGWSLSLRLQVFLWGDERGR
jgi:7-carboxy-7-deazaguanine synthase